jgi:hypothetical protein
MFRMCNTFEDFRDFAFETVGGDMNMFEKQFISNGEDLIVEDGEWPPLEDYIEEHWLDAPSDYPVVVYGRLQREADRNGPVTIFTWDWTPLDFL